MLCAERLFRLVEDRDFHRRECIGFDEPWWTVPSVDD